MKIQIIDTKHFDFGKTFNVKKTHAASDMIEYFVSDYKSFSDYQVRVITEKKG
jgi:hypothetical protein